MFFIKDKNHLLVFFGLLAVFLLGRAQQVSDSRFTILLSHALYSNFNNNLKPFLDFPEIKNNIDNLTQSYDQQGNIIEHGQIIKQNQTMANEKWVMKYSQVPAILTMPFVLILDNLGLTVVDEKKMWSPSNEIRQQVIIASILAALFGVVLYSIAKIWLEPKIAILVTMFLILGSGVASTMSRALWTDTWGSLLTILAIQHLVFAHKREKNINIFYIIILVSLAVFCKPLYVFSAIACAIWVVVINKHSFFKLNIYTIFAASVYLIWSLLSNKSIVANYHFGNFNLFNLEYFAGILISPSRGILVFCPWIFFIFIAYLYLRKKIISEDNKIIIISLLPVIGLIFLLSSYELWWAGFAYGARLQSPTLSWLFVIAIIVVHTLIKNISTAKCAEKGLISLGVFSGVLAMLINLYGVNQTKAFWDWHLNIRYDRQKHKSADEAIIERMWDWRDPIFLAGIIGSERYQKPPKINN